MQPKQASVNDHALMQITGKELGQFFRAPIAWLFLAAFLLVSLFVFFWVESFFARNIADVRPLFEWMPVLLIFLSSALTMKMWSEERRSGTLEHVLTQPVPLWQFVVGKFLACWALLAIALLLTLPLPITVSMLGQLDWGPVFERDQIEQALLSSEEPLVDELTEAGWMTIYEDEEFVVLVPG